LEERALVERSVWDNCLAVRKPVESAVAGTGMVESAKNSVLTATVDMEFSFNMLYLPIVCE